MCSAAPLNAKMLNETGLKETADNCTACNLLQDLTGYLAYLALLNHIRKHHLSRFFLNNTAVPQMIRPFGLCWRVEHLSCIAVQRLYHVHLRGRRQLKLRHHVRAVHRSALHALDDLFAWMRLPALSLITLVRPSFRPGGNAHCLARPDVPLLWNSLQHNIHSPQPAKALSCSRNASGLLKTK